MNMFCSQCQEAKDNKGCTVAGICGKPSDVSNSQDLLLFLTKGISWWAKQAREQGCEDEEVNTFVIKSLFSTVTNVNFDSSRMNQLIENAFQIRDKASNLSNGIKERKNITIPKAARFSRDEAIEVFTHRDSPTAPKKKEDEDIQSLIQLLVGGLKGIAAYYDHASLLHHSNKEIIRFVQEALAWTIEPDISTKKLFELVLESGNKSVEVLKLLDTANTSAYGNPEITTVTTGTKKTPAILVSGHDLVDLEEILNQTVGSGILVYTHGEMLPAHAYPKFKRYSHLAGNFGTSWYNQQKEFDKFNGAIVMTTNCIQKPRDSYKDRIFTTGLVAWDGVQHIADRKSGREKDFKVVIKKALDAGDLEETEGQEIPIGFSHHQVLHLADKIVEAVKSGAIKRFVVMAGCDGKQKERGYYTDVARNLPKDTVILTAGCAKYRYNMLSLGDISGIPRVIDAGQCNDSYSLAVIALTLKDVFKVDDINDLPISYDIAWYEQKAVCVLLALLSLGVKKIRLGPTLPAYLSENIINVLVDKFAIKAIAAPKEDIDAMMTGN